MQFVYTPRGTCSTRMVFDIEDGVIRDLKVEHGCNGNLKGIAALIRGCRPEDVIERLEGIRCGVRSTSCPDQIANGLKQYLSGQ